MLTRSTLGIAIGLPAYMNPKQAIIVWGQGSRLTLRGIRATAPFSNSKALTPCPQQIARLGFFLLLEKPDCDWSHQRKTLSWRLIPVPLAA